MTRKRQKGEVPSRLLLGSRRWRFKGGGRMTVWVAGLVIAAATSTSAAIAAPEAGITVTGIASTAGGDARVAIIERDGQMYIVGIGEHIGDAVVVAISATEVTFRQTGRVLVLAISHAATSSLAAPAAPSTTVTPPTSAPSYPPDQPSPAPAPAVPAPYGDSYPTSPYPTVPAYPYPPAYYPPLAGNVLGTTYDGGLSYLLVNGHYGYYYWYPYYGRYYHYYYRPYYRPYYGGFTRAPAFMWTSRGWSFRRR